MRKWCCFPPGVKNVEVDLGNQVVRVLGSSSVKETEALKQTGRNARLIGQGVPEGWPMGYLDCLMPFEDLIDGWTVVL
mgnify:CR=1 FL=1